MCNQLVDVQLALVRYLSIVLHIQSYRHTLDTVISMEYGIETGYLATSSRTHSFVPLTPLLSFGCLNEEENLTKHVLPINLRFSQRAACGNDYTCPTKPLPLNQMCVLHATTYAYTLPPFTSHPRTVPSHETTSLRPRLSSEYFIIRCLKCQQQISLSPAHGNTRTGAEKRTDRSRKTEGQEQRNTRTEAEIQTDRSRAIEGQEQGNRTTRAEKTHGRERRDRRTIARKETDRSRKTYGQEQR